MATKSGDVQFLVTSSQHGLTQFIDAVRREDVLCRVDFSRPDRHDFPFDSTVELMKRIACLSWHYVAYNRNPYGARRAWGGEVPFIR
jgi:hypothetical protein